MTESEKKTAFQRALEHTMKGSFDELGVVEDNEGKLLLPTSIDRRRGTGRIESKKVMLKIPTNEQRISARRRARDRIKEYNLDEEKDAHFFDEFENYELLAFAIRDPEPPYIQYAPNGEELAKLHDYRQLAKVWTVLDQWTQANDPRFGELEAAEMWDIIQRIAARGDATPLGDIGGFEQATCITFMAKELVRFRTSQ